MNKTAMVRARIEPKLKESAEKIFNKVGLSTTEAITLFYKQVELRSGLPFDLVIPNELTKKTLDKTDDGKELIVCEDAKDMFERLGI
jgi:DNA-damage-inducible protein J